jgi:hypothetical protein
MLSAYFYFFFQNKESRPKFPVVSFLLAFPSEGKRPLGRQRRRWVDSIKIDLREDGMVWIGFMWLRIGTSGGLL